MGRGLEVRWMHLQDGDWVVGEPVIDNGGVREIEIGEGSLLVNEVREVDAGCRAEVSLAFPEGVKVGWSNGDGFVCIADYEPDGRVDKMMVVLQRREFPGAVGLVMWVNMHVGHMISVSTDDNEERYLLLMWEGGEAGRMRCPEEVDGGEWYRSLMVMGLESTEQRQSLESLVDRYWESNDGGVASWRRVGARGERVMGLSLDEQTWLVAVGSEGPYRVVCPPWWDLRVLSWGQNLGRGMWDVYLVGVNGISGELVVNEEECWVYCGGNG